jgi:poly(A) polymerase
MLEAGLTNTDKRIQQEKPVTPAFLYATLLWPEVDRLWNQFMNEGVPEFPALQQAGQHALQSQLPHISIPKRFTLMMKEIWEYQIRLTKTNGKRPFHLAEQPRFRAAYDFLLLRVQAGEPLEDLASWWTDFQVKHPGAVYNRATHGKRKDSANGNRHKPRQSRRPKRS